MALTSIEVLLALASYLGDPASQMLRSIFISQEKGFWSGVCPPQFTGLRIHAAFSSVACMLQTLQDLVKCVSDSVDVRVSVSVTVNTWQQMEVSRLPSRHMPLLPG